MKNPPPIPDIMAYPCLFPIKVFGLADAHFQAIVLELINPHYAADEDDVRVNYSKEGKYISLTVTIQATSKAQLDAIYMALTSDKRILMVL